MELKISKQAGYVLVSTSGPIDDSAGPLLRDEVHPLVGERGTKLVLDLSGSERINSIGISHLVRLVSDANTNGSRVVLSGANAFVSGVLSVTRLDRFFEMAENVAAAAALLGE